MSSTQQSQLPVIYLGQYSFWYGPKGLTYDQETNVGIHSILNGQEQTEANGFTSGKLMWEGFFRSTNNQALQDLYQFMSAVQTGYFNRPMCYGAFSQDFSGASSSQLWYSGVGYVSNVHLEYKGGYGIYKYPFRLQTIQANPVTLIATSTTINSTNVAYSFSLAGLVNGYIAGVAIKGSSFGTTGNLAQNIGAVNTGAGLVGQGSTLGISGVNQLMSGNPLYVNTSGPNGNNMLLYWPVSDTSFNQSILISGAAAQTPAVVTFSQNWNAAHLPSNIYLVWVPA